MRYSMILTGFLLSGTLSVCLSGCCDFDGLGDAASVIGAGVEVFKDAQNAAGTAELKAEGCSNAMVTTPEMFAKVEKTLDKMDGDKEGELPKDLTIVNCGIEGSVKAPDCDTLARTFIKASSPTTKFMMTVQRAGQEGAVCNKTYDPDFK